MKLSYTPGEKLSIPRPVDRVNYIVEVCIGKNVLDLGCYDETALIKENTGKYLFTEISKVAKLHFGVDNSAQLPKEGITYSPTEKIIKGDIYNLHQMDFNQTQFDVIIAAGAIGAIYIIGRTVGKIFGAYLGCSIVNADKNVKKYLGLCLLPQAGVALGMAYQAKSDFGDSGTIVLIVVLIATLVYELFGPIGVKMALYDANEIQLDK